MLLAQKDDLMKIMNRQSYLIERALPKKDNSLD